MTGQFHSFPSKKSLNLRHLASVTNNKLGMFRSFIIIGKGQREEEEEKRFDGIDCKACAVTVRMSERSQLTSLSIHPFIQIVVMQRIYGTVSCVVASLSLRKVN